MGFIEAELSFPMGTHVFRTEAFLLVLPTTEYQKRVPVTIGTSLTDMAVDSLGTLDQTELTTLWKTMLCHPVPEKSTGTTNSEEHRQNY